MYLGKSKLYCIKMLISNSMKDGVINHDEYLMILNEKKSYDNMNNEDTFNAKYSLP